MTSGSGKRQRDITLSARFSGDEAAQVRASADREGVSVATLLRRAVLGGAAGPATRHAPVSTVLLTRFLHALGPLTAALRALADRPEIGRDDPALSSALAEVGDMSFACLQLMGRGRPWRRAVADHGADSEGLSAIFARAHGPIPAGPVLPSLPFPPSPTGGPS